MSRFIICLIRTDINNNQIKLFMSDQNYNVCDITICPSGINFVKNKTVIRDFTCKCLVNNECTSI